MGTWKTIKDTIYLTSTDKPRPTFSIEESGPQFKDTLNIEILGRVDRTPLEYCNIIFLDNKKRMMEGRYVENGFISLTTPSTIKFLTIQSMISPSFDIDLSLITKRDIKLLLDVSMNRFKNVSDQKFIKDKKGNLVNIDTENRQTTYILEK